MKKFKEFIKSQKTSQEKQKEIAVRSNGTTANDSIIKTGLEQSAQIASFKNYENNS